MNGVITMSLKNEVYYHWAEVMFKSILRFTDVDFALVYDDENLFKKYNLDKIVKYPMHLLNVENPYIFKYELVNVSPFDNTIFLDADTVILKILHHYLMNNFYLFVVSGIMIGCTMSIHRSHLTLVK